MLQRKAILISTPHHGTTQLVNQYHASHQGRRDTMAACPYHQVQHQGHKPGCMNLQAQKTHCVASWLPYVAQRLKVMHECHARTAAIQPEVLYVQRQSVHYDPAIQMLTDSSKVSFMHNNIIYIWSSFCEEQQHQQWCNRL